MAADMFPIPLPLKVDFAAITPLCEVFRWRKFAPAAGHNVGGLMVTSARTNRDYEDDNPVIRVARPS
jgi:hypothetical protein